jgi:two-component system response regulator PilR (NtrC family)
VLSIQLPPLRERPEDVAPLVEHFLEKHRLLSPSRAPAADPDFLEALRKLSLLGNVRQLENLVRQALVGHATDSSLGLNDLPAELLRELFSPDQSLAPVDGPSSKPQKAGVFDSGELLNCMVCVLEANGWNLKCSLENCERHALEAAMMQTRGNQTKTARLLGITSRSVYNKVRKHQLKF